MHGPQEKFPFGRQRCVNVLLAVDVLLRAVHHANVTSPQRQQLVLQYVPRIRTVIHQIQFCDHADGADA